MQKEQQPKNCPSPENPCFCDCHRDGDGTRWCMDCLGGRHKTMTQQQPSKWEETALEQLLKALNEAVFVKSTNSVSGDEELLNPEIVDMEAIIRISGEFDREDLKRILSDIYRTHLTALGEELTQTVENMKTETFPRLGYTGEKLIRENTLSDTRTAISKVLEQHGVKIK